MKILKDVFPLMSPVRDVIIELSGEQYPTCSLIIPIIHCMEKNITSVNSKAVIRKQF